MAKNESDRATQPRVCIGHFFAPFPTPVSHDSLMRWRLPLVLTAPRLGPGAAIAGAAVGAVAIAALLARGRPHVGATTSAAPSPAVAIVERTSLLPAPLRVPPLEGIDLTRIALADDGATAPAAEHRVARLTLDPELQRAADRIMAAYHLPEAAMVLVNVATGKVLTYASHIEHGEKRDLCPEATAPSASVFRIVTGAALVEDAGLSPETRQCYSGGEQKILPSDIEDDPHRDRWCTTLAGAMGHSTNAVFAKLALHDLKRESLEAMASRLGYGEPVPFDVPVQPSALELPANPLGYARTAAGFWNSTLSPLEAVWLSAIVARGGEAPRLSIVGEVVDDRGGLVYTAPAPSTVRRAMQRDASPGAHENDGGHRLGRDVLPGFPRRAAAVFSPRRRRRGEDGHPHQRSEISTFTPGSPASRRAVRSRGCSRCRRSRSPCSS